MVERIKMLNREESAMRLLKSKKRCMKIRVSVVFVLGLVGLIYNIQRGLPSSSQGAYIIILLFSSWAYYNNPITAS